GPSVRMITTRRLLTPRYLVHVAAVVWLILTSVVCVRAFVWPYRHSTLLIYVTAAKNWMGHCDLYAEQPGLKDLYRYSPTVAVLMVPIPLLPDNLAGLLWRLLNLAGFFGGITWWCRSVLPRAGTITSRQWAMFSLLLLPLAVESINNGQLNPLMVGLILAA